MTTVPIFKNCMNMLMENAPDSIDMVELYNGLHEVRNIIIIF